MNSSPDRSIVFFKDSDRILLSPFIPHIGGFSVNSDWFRVITDLNHIEVGNAIFEAIEVIKTSPVSKLTDEECKKTALWKIERRYRSFISFWRSNNIAYVKQKRLFVKCGGKKKQRVFRINKVELKSI